MRLPARGFRAAVSYAVAAVPASTVLAGLALLGTLPWEAAVLGALVAAALTGLLLRRHNNRLSALGRAIRALGAANPAEPAPPARAGTELLCPELEDVVAETMRERLQERLELEQIVAENDAIIDALPDPLILLQANRRILRANPAAIELFEGPLAGRDLPSVLRNPELLAAVDAVLGGSERRRLVEFVWPGPVTRYLRARVARLAQPARDGTSAILALHDLTAVKRAEQMRADFVANVSHELRTPLTSLLGFVETLQGPAREDAEARDRFLEIMREQAARMSRLVADLLSLSRIEMDEHNPPRGTADLTAVLRAVARTLEPRAREKGMTIELDLGPSQPVTGEVDGLSEVFENLIDNAIKYGRAGTPVRVSLRPAGPGTAGARRLGRPGVKVAVADQGEGIAREHLPRLTERFYRVDTARSRQLGGTGLGLAIVKHIVNRHRGVLDIESTPGRGSVFTVWLPAAEVAAQQAKAP